MKITRDEMARAKDKKKRRKGGTDEDRQRSDHDVRVFKGPARSDLSEGHLLRLCGRMNEPLFVWFAFSFLFVCLLFYLFVSSSCLGPH